MLPTILEQGSGPRRGAYLSHSSRTHFQEQAPQSLEALYSALPSLAELAAAGWSASQGLQSPHAAHACSMCSSGGTARFAAHRGSACKHAPHSAINAGFRRVWVR
jgi:hypothetical protein